MTCSSEHTYLLWSLVWHCRSIFGLIWVPRNSIFFIQGAPHYSVTAYPACSFSTYPKLPRDDSATRERTNVIVSCDYFNKTKPLQPRACIEQSQIMTISQQQSFDFHNVDVPQAPQCLGGPFDALVLLSGGYE
jgi:hypothetical protein